MIHRAQIVRSSKAATAASIARGGRAPAGAEALHELEAIFELTIVGLVRLSDRVIVRCNRRAEELFGYGPGEMIGQSTRIWYRNHEDFVTLGLSAYADLSAGRIHNREQLFRRRDGVEFWGRIAGRAHDPAKPFDCVLLLEDLSERKAAEERLQAALDDQQLMFDNAAVGFMYVTNRVIQRCNRRLEEIFGYAPGELAGASTRSLYADAGAYARHGADAYGAVGRDGSYASDVRVRHKDGTDFWVRASARRIDTGPDDVSLIWTLEDITDRTLAEQAVQRYQLELEKRVGERTAELEATNRRLQAEVEERCQAERRIWDLAHRDELTRLPNRSLLLDRLENALAQARRHRRRVALMFIDVDRFKGINDTLGHAAGDRLLQEVAQRLAAAVRSTDTVARLGGDEFVVLLSDIAQPSDAAAVADKLLQAFQASMLLDGHPIHFTASIGVSVYPDDGEDAGALMRNADTAMYRAKAGGRNTTMFFTAEMNAAVTRLFRFESSLRTALAQGEFELHYQPLVDAATLGVVGMEALLRWNSPDGPVRPDEFIPVAEETGQILPIGDWVLHEACSQAMRWQAEGRPPLTMAVNLSPRQFRHPGLVEDVERVLRETGLAPRWLELEITESSLMAQTEETMAKLHALSRMGIRLAIDDFGTGYSSLNYLKRFPVDKLKIDQSFVREIFTDRDDAAIVMAIIQLAKSLGLTTLAEGVETAEQLAALLKAGCSEFQGYYFSRPLPAREADRLFAVGR